MKPPQIRKAAAALGITPEAIKRPAVASASGRGRTRNHSGAVTFEKVTFFCL
jgi:hypothetical protein